MFRNKKSKNEMPSYEIPNSDQSIQMKLNSKPIDRNSYQNNKKNIVCSNEKINLTSPQKNEHSMNNLINSTAKKQQQSSSSLVKKTSKEDNEDFYVEEFERKNIHMRETFKCKDSREFGFPFMDSQNENEYKEFESKKNVSLPPIHLGNGKNVFDSSQDSKKHQSKFHNNKLSFNDLNNKEVSSFKINKENNIASLSNNVEDVDRLNQTEYLSLKKEVFENQIKNTKSVGSQKDITAPLKIMR